MEEAWAKFGKTVALKATWITLALLFAFPFKWCWNYTLPWMFRFPYIEWGHAFCLLYVIASCKQVILWCDHKKD